MHRRADLDDRWLGYEVWVGGHTATQVTLVPSMNVLIFSPDVDIERDGDALVRKAMRDVAAGAVAARPCPTS